MSQLQTWLGAWAAKAWGRVRLHGALARPRRFGDLQRREALRKVLFCGAAHFVVLVAQQGEQHVAVGMARHRQVQALGLARAVEEEPGDCCRGIGMHGEDLAQHGIVHGQQGFEHVGRALGVSGEHAGGVGHQLLGIVVLAAVPDEAHLLCRGVSSFSVQ